jgi:hypothetical protein
MKFNDVLAIILAAVVIPAIWIAQGYDMVEIPGEINGVLLSGWTLIIQYYFRKKPTNENTPSNTSK